MTRAQRGLERQGGERYRQSLQDEAPQQLLRPISESDLPAVVAVERAGYLHPWAESVFADSLRAGHHCWLVTHGKRVIAHGIMMVAAGEAHILNLCVHPQRQRRGVGRRLLRHLLHLARRHDADMALLEVRPSNREAIALYESLGFNEIGRRPNYYPALHGEREDALMMARTLLEWERSRGDELW